MIPRIVKFAALLALVSADGIPAYNAYAWDVVEQPGLFKAFDDAPTIKLEKIEGITSSDKCWIGPGWWLKNPDGETYDHVRFYSPNYMGPHQVTVFDFKTGEVRSQSSGTQSMFHLQPLYPLGSKYFVRPAHGHKIWYYDAVENKFVYSGKEIEEALGGPWILTPDKQLWAFGNTEVDGVNRIAFYKIDSRTCDHEQVALAPQPEEKENTYRGRYATVQCDGDWIYVEMGNWPWVVVGLNHKTGESRLIAETEMIHGDYNTIGLGRPHKYRDMAGLLLTITDMKGHKGETLEFWLRDGELTPKTGDTPPWPDRREKTDHISRLPYSGFGQPEDIETVHRGPSSDGMIRIWYRLKGKALEHAQSWASEEVKRGGWGFYEFEATFYPESWAQAVPVGDKLLMVGSGYARHRLVDPIAKTSALIDNVMSTKSTSPCAYNGKAYMAGYGAFQVWEYDPSKPWTKESGYKIPPDSDRKPIDRSSPEHNPRQLVKNLQRQSHTQTPNSGVVLAADGFLYAGGPISRIGNGGGIGWVNPETLEQDGEYEPFTAYRVAKMCTADNGRYVVISCIPAGYDDANPDFKPEHGMTFVRDTTTGTYIQKVSDKQWYWPGGVQDAGEGRIIGWAGRDKNGEEPGFIYGMDAKSGKILWRKDVPEGPSAGHRYRQPGTTLAPDGRIWAMISGVMVRIHPEDGRIEVIGKPNLKTGNICWLENGQAYSFSDSTLYRWPEKWNCRPSASHAR